MKKSFRLFNLSISKDQHETDMIRSWSNENAAFYFYFCSDRMEKIFLKKLYFHMLNSNVNYQELWNFLKNSFGNKFKQPCHLLKKRNKAWFSLYFYPNDVFLLTERTKLASSGGSYHSAVFHPIESQLIATANSIFGISLWDIRRPLKWVYFNLFIYYFLFAWCVFHRGKEEEFYSSRIRTNFEML